MRATSSPVRRVAAAAAACALLVVAGCGSAEDAALSADDTTTRTAAPTDEPTTDPTDAPTTSAPTTAPTETAPTVPVVGECRTLATLDVRARIATLTTPPVACGGTHNAQTYKVATQNAAVKQAIEGGNRVTIFAAARRSCELDLPGYLGVDDERQKQSQFDFVISVPTSAEVAAGATWVRCDVVLKNGQTKAEPLPDANAKNSLRGAKGNPYLQCIRSSNINQASGTFLCRDAHNWRSVSAIKLGVGSKAFPGTSELTSFVRGRCSTAVRRYLDTSASFEYGYIVPTADLWKYGDRWAVCFAKTRR
ncbi:MAG: septum formation family protein [Nocardioidaceae bacterium]|nr:septum formation family protein [Nocardioidaceae bacterium]